MLTTRIAAGVLSSFLVWAASEVAAQAFPNKPIRILAGVSGGNNDVLSRILSQGISEPLGQPLIVENRPGGYATETVAKAQPDGYTLLSQGQSMWLASYMRENVPWNMTDFTPITIQTQGPNILVVNPAVPVNSVKELIALAKAKPGALNYSLGGAGTAVHLAAELFKAMADVNIVGIPYKGGGPISINAVIAGECQLSFPTAAGVSSFLKTGKLRALAITSAQPSPLNPGLPTMAASGVPGYESVNMTGIFAPAKTPAAVIRRLNQEIVRVLNKSDVKERIANFGAEVVGNAPEQAAAMIKADMARLGKVIKDAGIREE